MGRAAPDPREEILTHLPALRALARGLAGDTDRADDLVQDTMEKAWTNVDRFRPGTDMWGWLFTILRNTWYSDLRRAGREVPSGLAAYRDGPAVAPAHDSRLALAEIRAALQRLPAPQREAILLVGAMGYGYEEAAGLIGVPAGTVKSRTNRARARLASALGLTAGTATVPTRTIRAVETGEQRLR